MNYLNYSLIASTKRSTALSGNRGFGGLASNPRTWFQTYVQPWLAFIGVLDNLLVVLIFGPFLTRWCTLASGRCCKSAAGKGGREVGGVALVSRIYYVVISAGEVANIISGYILRNTITYLPYAV